VLADDIGWPDLSIADGRSVAIAADGRARLAGADGAAPSDIMAGAEPEQAMRTMASTAPPR
jgi:hypothetical protein